MSNHENNQLSSNNPTGDVPLRTLIEQVLNGQATAEQVATLEQRLLADEQAREAYLRYVNLHAALRRRFMAEADAAQIEVAPQSPFTQESSRKARRWSVAMMVSAALVAASLLIAFGKWDQAPPSPTDVPQIARIAGGVRIVLPDGTSQTAVAGQVLQLGETLQLTGEDDDIVLRYADGTEVRLWGIARLQIAHSELGGKQLELQRGLLDADVAAQPVGRPMLIVTPQTSVRVLGTRFELAADTSSGTRLDLESGSVQLVRGNEPPVVVQPNSVAVVSSGDQTIQISPRMEVISTPQRELHFGGLRSVGFAVAGKTVVGSSRKQAVYWYADDRLEAVPILPSEDKGISFKAQAGSLLAYESAMPRKLTFWDTQTRQSVFSFEAYAELPASEADVQARSLPEANIAAMSPRGEWVAFISRGGQFNRRRFQVWSVESGLWLDYAAHYDGQSLPAMAASPDGRFLAIASRRTAVEVLNALTGEVVVSWPIADQVPISLNFSADGAKLAAGFHDQVKIYDIASGAAAAVYEHPGVSFVKVALSNDGRYLAAASLSHRIWRWDTRTEEQLPQIRCDDSVRDMAFAPQGRQLAVATNGRLTLWDRDTLPVNSEVGRQ